MASHRAAYVRIGDVAVGTGESRRALAPISIDKINAQTVTTSARIAGTFVDVRSAFVTCMTRMA